MGARNQHLWTLHQKDLKLNIGKIHLCKMLEKLPFLSMYCQDRREHQMKECYNTRGDWLIVPMIETKEHNNSQTYWGLSDDLLVRLA